MIATIYQDILSKEPYPSDFELLLDRIQDGTSRALVEMIRTAADKENRDKLKRKLPAVVWSAVMHPGPRSDENIAQHSGLVVLDFDHIQEPEAWRDSIADDPYIVASWLSPSGEGVKALVEIADPDRHREHFGAMLERWPELDPSGANPSRVCFESWDPNIMRNDTWDLWDMVPEKKEPEPQPMAIPSSDGFTRLVKWMEASGEHYIEGNRNNYILRLAGACNRFGIPQGDTLSLALMQFKDLPEKEVTATVKSAYKKTEDHGIEQFDQLTKPTKTQKIKAKRRTKNSVDPSDLFTRDYQAHQVEAYARLGPPTAMATGLELMDRNLRVLRGQLMTVFGHPSHGKSSWVEWLMVQLSRNHGFKWFVYAPESGKGIETFKRLMEWHTQGGDLTQLDEDRMAEVYDFVDEHFFILDPEDWPDINIADFYQMARDEGHSRGIEFDGTLIDPFNDLDFLHDKTGRDVAMNKQLKEARLDCLGSGRFNIISTHASNIGMTYEKASGKTVRYYDEAGPNEIESGMSWWKRSDYLASVWRPNMDLEDPILREYSRHAQHLFEGLMRIHIYKVKTQHHGVKGPVDLHFDFKTKTITAGDTLAPGSQPPQPSSPAIKDHYETEKDMTKKEIEEITRMLGEKQDFDQASDDVPF